jgi:hypothetical protein
LLRRGVASLFARNLKIGSHFGIRTSLPFPKHLSHLRDMINLSIGWECRCHSKREIVVS